MSLYYEAAAFLKNATENNELSSSSIYGKKDLKTKPAQIVALISQTAKWSAHLSSIIEHVEILRLERKVYGPFVLSEITLTRSLAHSTTVNTTDA